ncbi:MAG TPA: hypothetical protein V6C81_21700 [Planktothrix sp.]|jgi:hypothetical protein
MSNKNQPSGSNNGSFNLNLAQEAHGITASHLTAPRGDRLPEVQWGSVQHRAVTAREIAPPLQVTANFIHR